MFTKEFGFLKNDLYLCIMKNRSIIDELTIKTKIGEIEWTPQGGTQYVVHIDDLWIRVRECPFVYTIGISDNKYGPFPPLAIHDFWGRKIRKLYRAIHTVERNAAVNKLSKIL